MSVKMEKKLAVLFVATLVTMLFVAGCAQGIGAVLKQGPGNKADGTKYFIEDLRQEKFKGKGIKIIKTLEEGPAFTRYLIGYESQGLSISGMMNVPNGEGRFPVVILNHGHYESNKKFSIGLGFKDAADIFAKNGYVAVGSDFRNNGNSDNGENLFQHLGDLYDVLYLLEAVKELPYVDKEKIGMWGYSLGGWLTLKSVVISSDIKVVALFGSMSADDTDNYYTLKKWHSEVLENVTKIFGTPEERPDNYARLSPVNYFSDLSAKVIIHHGIKDTLTPYEWSQKLNETLGKKEKIVEFYTYRYQGHLFHGKDWNKAMERTVNFFNRYLKG